MNAHYEPIHQICRLLLEGSGVEEQHGPRAISSFLIDMNKVFEMFVAGWLAEHLAPPVTVLAQLSDTLDRTRRLSITPDLVFAANGTPFLVADSKYKRLKAGRPRIGDVYQIMAYCRALDLRKGVLIHAEEIPEPLEYPIKNCEDRVESCGVGLGGSVGQIEDQMWRIAERVLGSRSRVVELKAGVAG